MLRGERIEAPSVVCAVPWNALATTIRGPSDSLVPILTAAAGTASSPIVTVNLWYDRPVLDEMMVGPTRARISVGVRQGTYLRSRAIAPVAGRQRSGGDRRPWQRRARHHCRERCCGGRACRARGPASPRIGSARAARDVFTGAGTAGPPKDSHASKRTAARRRLGGYRAASDDRRRGRLRALGRGRGTKAVTGTTSAHGTCATRLAIDRSGCRKLPAMLPTRRRWRGPRPQISRSWVVASSGCGRPFASRRRSRPAMSCCSSRISAAAAPRAKRRVCPVLVAQARLVEPAPGLR